MKRLCARTLNVMKKLGGVKLMKPPLVMILVLVVRAGPCFRERKRSALVRVASTFQVVGGIFRCFVAPLVLHQFVELQLLRKNKKVQCFQGFRDLFESPYHTGCQLINDPI